MPQISIICLFCLLYLCQPLFAQQNQADPLDHSIQQEKQSKKYLNSPATAGTQLHLESEYAQEEEQAALMQKAELMTASGDEESALKLWKEILETDPDNQLALNRASFLSARVGNRLGSDQQAKFFFQAKNFAERSLEIFEESADANFVMAMAMGRIALVAPARDRVEASRRIRQFAERSLELDQSHAGAWHILGLWHFRMASMSVAEKEAAKALYGANSTGASKEKAIKAMKTAIDLRPGYLLYQHDLAKVYLSEGAKDKANVILKGILTNPESSPDDAGIKAICRETLKG